MKRVTGSTEDMKVRVETIYKFWKYPHQTEGMYDRDVAVIGTIFLMDWSFSIVGNNVEYRVRQRQNIMVQNTDPPTDLLWSCRLDEISAIDISNYKDSVAGNNLVADCWDVKTAKFYSGSYKHLMDFFVYNSSSHKYEPVASMRKVTERSTLDMESDLTYNIYVMSVFLNNGRVLLLAQGVERYTFQPRQRFLIKQAQLWKLIRECRQNNRPDDDRKLYL